MQADVRGARPLKHDRNVETTRSSLEDCKKVTSSVDHTRRRVLCITSSDLTRMPIKRDRVPPSFIFSILCSPSTNKHRTAARNLEVSDGSACRGLQSKMCGRSLDSTWRTLAYVELLIQKQVAHAVAERPRDASCLSVVSLSSTIPRAPSFISSYFGFRFTNAFVPLISAWRWAFLS